MTVRKEVLVPKMTEKLDPRDVMPKEAGVWEEQTREAEAQVKYELARQKLEEIKDPGKREVAKPAFQVTGEVSLGKFDLQAQQQEMQNRLKEVETKYQGMIDKINADTDNYREQVHALELQMMRDQMAVQIENLNKQLTLNVNQKAPSFLEQLESVRALAKELGFQTPGAGTGGDVAMQVQMIKLQNDSAREAREWEFKMKQWDLEREMRIMEITGKNQVEMERLKLERERNNMLASFPEMLGGAIARGILDSGGEGIPFIGRAAAPVQSAPPKEKSYKVEIYEGEMGQFACPYCGTEIGVGPATQLAVCTACGKSLPVERRPRPIGQPDPMLSPEEAERNG